MTGSGASAHHPAHPPTPVARLDTMATEVTRMASGGTTITWFGHACVEVRTPGGKVVLFDPWFANPRSPRPPDQVERCDVMLVTHGHADHSGNALPIASRTRPVWPAIHELQLWLNSIYSAPDDVIGMNKGGTVEARGLGVTMTYADHSAGDWDAERQRRATSASRRASSSSSRTAAGSTYAGDTNVFGDMRLIGELYKPGPGDAADRRALHDGPARGRPGGRATSASREVLPLHYGTIPILRGHAGGAPVRARRARPCRRDRPRPGARRIDRSLTPG